CVVAFCSRCCFFLHSPRSFPPSRLPALPTRRSSDLGALELLPRAGIDRVAAAAHGLPGGELELEQTEVCVVRLVHRTGVEVQAQIGRAPRLNSSHVSISYAVFCLKKKTTSGILCSND